jgi:DNA-binding transcriptional LysR family regulator
VQHLGVLPAEIQVNIILLYQLLESVLLDVKPGGLLNATEVGREPFEEAVRMLEKSRGLAHETLRQLEGKYPRLLKMAASA